MKEEIEMNQVDNSWLPIVRDILSRRDCEQKWLTTGTPGRLQHDPQIAILVRIQLIDVAPWTLSPSHRVGIGT
jgi:hypothetical protein